MMPLTPLAAVLPLPPLMLRCFFAPLMLPPACSFHASVADGRRRCAILMPPMMPPPLFSLAATISPCRQRR